MENGFIFDVDSPRLFAVSWGIAEESFAARAACGAALVHGLTLVTRNVEDFGATGARLLNPWEAPIS